jgi:hypothetical protein
MAVWGKRSGRGRYSDLDRAHTSEGSRQMPNSIHQIPVEGNIDCIALQKVCDDLHKAHKAALRALKNANPALNYPLTDMPASPPVHMDELRVRYWLREQDGPVTSRKVAETLFTSRPPSKSLSMSMAKYIKAAGWQRLKRVQGTQYWARVS